VSQLASLWRFQNSKENAVRRSARPPATACASPSRKPLRLSHPRMERYPITTAVPERLSTQLSGQLTLIRGAVSDSSRTMGMSIA